MKQGNWGTDRRTPTEVRGQKSDPPSPSFGATSAGRLNSPLIWSARTCPASRHGGISQSQSGAKSPQSKFQCPARRVPVSGFCVSASAFRVPKGQLLPSLATGGLPSPSAHDPRPFRNSLIGNVRRARSCRIVEGVGGWNCIGARDSSRFNVTGGRVLGPFYNPILCGR
jgi:hypothetical protein